MVFSRTCCTLLILAFLYSPALGQENVIQLKPVRPAELLRDSAEVQSPDDIQDFKTLSMRAEALRAAGRNDEALLFYQKMESLDEFQSHPNKNIIRLKIGELLQDIGRKEEALKQYKSVVADLEEDSSADAKRLRNSALLRMGTAYNEMGNSLKSKDIYLYLLQDSSGTDRARLVNNLLQFYAAGVMTAKEAQEILAEVPKDDMSAEYLHARLAMDAQRKGDNAVAIEEYSKTMEMGASALSPGRMESIYDLFDSEGQSDRLEQLLKDAHERKPTDDNVVLLLASLWNLQGRTEESMSLLEEASDTGPEVKAAFVQQALDSGRYEEAFEQAKQLVQLSPLSLSYQELYGDVLFRWGKRDEAAAYWKSLPSRFGQSDSIYITLSSILKKRGLTEDALEVLDRARRLDNASSIVQLEYLNSLLEARKIGEAWDEYLRLNRSSAQTMPTLRYRFISTIVRLGLSDEISPKLTALVFKTPRDSGASLALDVLEQIYIQEGKFKETLALFSNLPELSPAEQAGLIELAESLAQLGQYELALEAYDLLPANGRFRDDSLLHKARVLDTLGRTSEAIDLLAEVAWLPQSATRQMESGTPPGILTVSGMKANLAISEMLLKEKRPEVAGNYLNALISSTWRFMPQDEALVGFLLGDVYSQLGSLEQAREHYEKVQAIESEDLYEKAQFRLAELAFWTGRFEEAKERYSAFLESGFDRSLVNEALHRITLYTQASPTALESFSQAELFAWQHRYDDSIKMFRETAAENMDSDFSHWALFRVAQLMEETGKRQQAQQEYERLLSIVDNETLLGRLRERIVAFSDAKPQESLDDTIITMPDTIFADLARHQRQQMTQ